MKYTTSYTSPFGEMLLAASDNGLTGVWFENQKYFARNLDSGSINKETPILKDTKHWLDLYFKGENPNYLPQIDLIGTPFQISVWQILKKIPYGSVITYGDIAEKIAQTKGLVKMSSQAVGGAVGKNPISVIIPCHRVVGSNNSLTGYAAGIEIKKGLLKLENINISKFSEPKI